MVKGNFNVYLTRVIIIKNVNFKIIKYRSQSHEEINNKCRMHGYDIDYGPFFTVPVMVLYSFITWSFLRIINRI